MSMKRDYFDACDSAAERHPGGCLVLFQVGSFYEAYSFGSPGEEGFRGADVPALSALLGSQSFADQSDPRIRVCGFPCASADRHLGALVESGMCVELWEQAASPGKDGSFSRSPERFFSPALPPPSVGDGRESNLFVCAYVSASFACGVAGVDAFAGETWARQIPPPPPHGGSRAEAAEDALVRIAASESPRQLTVIAADRGVLDSLNLHSSPLEALAGRLDSEVPDRSSFLQAHVEATLDKVFPASSRGSEAALDHCGLRGLPLAAVALSHALRFAWAHDPRVLSVASPPEVRGCEGALSVEHSGLVQLDVLGQGGLAFKVARACTAPGRRLQRKRLGEPSADAGEIRERLGRVERLAEPGAAEAVAAALRGVRDPCNCVVKMAGGRMLPGDWAEVAALKEALDACRDLLPWWPGLGEAASAAGRPADEAAASLAPPAPGAKDPPGHPFARGAHPDLDEAADEIAAARAAVSGFCGRLNEAAGQAYFRVDPKCPEGASVLVTPARFARCREACSSVDLRPPGGPAAPLSGMSLAQCGASRHRLTSPALEAAAARMRSASQALAEEARARYAAFCASFAGRHGAALREASAALAEVDCACAWARHALRWGHCKPEVEDPGDGPSGVEAEDLRHPLVEARDPVVRYVGNSVALGGATPSLLLYGVNSSGKSCYMKSVGVAVVMAQAGMFVAAASMRLRPFERILTRIKGEDDIHTGRSTFLVEMGELKKIVCRAGPRSLVLGDEVCHGTESVSARAIVLASVRWLQRAGARFVFATHLHDLADERGFEEIRAGGTAVAHLSVRADPATGELVYDRRLAEGRGLPCYGVEICRGIGFPADFMSEVHAARRDQDKSQTDYIVPTKQSRYNSRVYMDACGGCGGRAGETHHIVHRSRGGGNARHNLLPLCEACHSRVHSEGLTPSYVQTSSGVHVSLVQKPLQ